MQSRNELLYSLHLANQAGDTEVADDIYVELENLDKSASLSELIPDVATPSNVQEQTSWDYVKDQMALRYGDWGSLIKRMGAASSYDPRIVQDLPKKAQEELHAVMTQDTSKQLASDVFGYQGLQPQGDFDKYAGIVGAAAVDPLTVIPATLPLKTISLGAGLLKTTKPFIMSALEWAIGTSSEVAGSIAAEGIEKSFKGTEYEDTTLDHLSRFAGAFVAGSLPSASTSTIKGGVSGYKAGKEIVQGDADNLSDLFSNQTVRAVLDSAVSNQSGSFNDRLKAAEQLQEQFPDLVLPLVDVVGENVVLAKEFKTLYSKDPIFRQKYDESAKKIQAQFEAYRENLIPSEGIDGKVIRNVVLEEADKKALVARKTAETKLQNIDNAKAKLAEKYDEAPLAFNIEQAARNVSESAEKAARENANVYYTNAFKYADDNGLTVPPEVVGDLWKYAEAQRTADLFSEFPTLYRKIEKFWSPKKTQGSGLLDAKGNLISPKAVLKFEPASIEDLDSLKRELNSAIRTTSDRAKKYSLSDLKEELDRQIRTVDPEFAKLYKAADAQYYEGIGLPTSLQGYRSVDSARFSTDLAGALTRPDQIRDYLNFVGKDAGIPVVRDALLMKARRSIITSTGEVDPNKLNRFVAVHKDALNEVPEIRDILINDGMLAERMARGKAKIDSSYNVYALEQSEGFFKALTNKNLDAIGTEVLSNPNSRETYLKQINSLSTSSRKIAITGLRQSLLDKAFSSKGTVVDFVKENRFAFDDVFGKKYSEHVQNLAVLRDIIDTNKDNLVSLAVSQKQKTGFQKVTGVTPEEVVGTLRNQIMSRARQALHLGFKVVITKTAEKADKALADVLLDTKALEALSKKTKELQKAMKNKTTSSVAAEALLETLKTFGATVAGYTTLGGVRGLSGSSINDDFENEKSLLPSQQEDDFLFAPKQQPQQ